MRTMEDINAELAEYRRQRNANNGCRDGVFVCDENGLAVIGASCPEMDELTLCNRDGDAFAASFEGRASQLSCFHADAEGMFLDTLFDSDVDEEEEEIDERWEAEIEEAREASSYDPDDDPIDYGQDYRAEIDRYTHPKGELIEEMFDAKHKSWINIRNTQECKRNLSRQPYDKGIKTVRWVPTRGFHRVDFPACKRAGCLEAMREIAA